MKPPKQVTYELVRNYAPGNLSSLAHRYHIDLLVAEYVSTAE